MQFQNKKKILIVDFGSQVTRLIARRVRELGVYSEIIPSKQINKIKYFKQYQRIYIIRWTINCNQKTISINTHQII